MTAKEIQALLEKQRNYYKGGATVSVDFRIEKLKALYAAVKKHEKEISEASDNTSPVSHIKLSY